MLYERTSEKARRLNATSVGERFVKNNIKRLKIVSAEPRSLPGHPDIILYQDRETESYYEYMRWRGD